MPSNNFMMWSMLFIMGLGAVGGPLIHGNLLSRVRAAYPADAASRAALNRCGEMDADFSRFLARDRDICYRAVLHAAERASASR